MRCTCVTSSVHYLNHVSPAISPVTLPCFVGVGLEWVEEPPDSVLIGEDFDVSYRVIITEDNFYEERYNESLFALP